MAPEWIYLLKVNAGIILFYACYKLFCQWDTFFAWRRTALLVFLAIFGLFFHYLQLTAGKLCLICKVLTLTFPIY